VFAHTSAEPVDVGMHETVRDLELR
jgi:hypothetical protein